MARLACITGREVIRRFTPDRWELAGMTIPAIGRQPHMMKRPGRPFTRVGNFNKRYDAPAGDASGADDQLHPIGAPRISEETGIRCVCVLQLSLAAIRPEGEGPVERQWIL